MDKRLESFLLELRKEMIKKRAQALLYYIICHNCYFNVSGLGIYIPGRGINISGLEILSRCKGR